jgi:hypothetical protein
MAPKPRAADAADMADAALALVLTLILAWLFGLHDFSHGFSGDTIYRQQTHALLSGRLALSWSPISLRYDEAWGRGVQQIWGLGVPILRLPFDAVVRAVGGFGFPDGVTFLIYFALVALLTARALGMPEPSATATSRARIVWERATVLTLLVLFPSFVNLCRTRFEVYEEAIAAAHLWSLLILALLLLLVAQPRTRTLALLGAAAGVASQFRPTIFLYGVVALAIGLHSAWRARLGRRALALGASLFALGFALQVFLNWWRFLSPFEVGQRLNLSYNPTDQLTKNFDAPYWHESLPRALAELFSSLFLRQEGNGYDFYRAGVLPLQSPALRFREFYFLTLRWWFFPLMLASWCAVAALWALRRRSTTARALLEDPRLTAAALFSFGGFVLMTAFYVKLPAMTSRYAVDFAAPIAAAMAVSWWLGFAVVRRLLDGRRAWAASLVLALLALALVAQPIATCWFGDIQSKHRLLDAADAAATLPASVHTPPPAPRQYHCGQSPKFFGDLNGFGWNASHNCLVNVSTPFFVAASPCYDLRVGPPGGESELLADRTRPVRARRGNVPLIRVRDVPYQNGRVLTFCAPSGAPENPTGIEVLSVAWIDPLTVKAINRPPMALTELLTSER